MTQEKRLTILSRIEKLLALSQSPNENEATAAAMKAQELLMEYGLSIEEIIPKEDKTISHEYFAEVDMTGWYDYLMLPLAEVFDVGLFYTGKGVARSYHIYGRKDHMENFKRMASFLTATVETLAAEATPQKLKSRQAQKFFDSFCAGCSRRIGERLKAKKLSMQEESKCRALVVRFKEELDTYANEKLRLRVGDGVKASLDRYAFWSGHRAGDTIGLDAQITH
jgi:predicted Fe-S protein YdhL (DUF1289 family)